MLEQYAYSNLNQKLELTGLENCKISYWSWSALGEFHTQIQLVISEIIIVSFQWKVW